MVKTDNASKHSQKLEIVVHRKCRREFRRFEALSFDSVVLRLFQ